jgi:hypothetical protein
MLNSGARRTRQVIFPSKVSTAHLLLCAGTCVIPFDSYPCHDLLSLLGLSTIGIDFLRIRRIKRHLDFIAMDDKLLLQNDAGINLSNRELQEALKERGLFVILPYDTLHFNHHFCPFLV